MIHVEILKRTPGALRPFIQLPFDIYRKDSHWAPPGRRELTLTLMGIDNEFFSRGIQRIFLAYDDETPVARVLAGIDLRLSSRLGIQSGYISLFESYENYEYAQAVLSRDEVSPGRTGRNRFSDPSRRDMTCSTGACWWRASTVRP